jgi:hypothetical protein
MQWKIGVSSAEACDEMVFERADCTFGCVAAVDLRGYKLVVDCFLGEVIFEELRAFIVKALELWSEAGFYKGGMGPFVGCEMFGSGASFHGLGVDGIAIEIV